MICRYHIEIRQADGSWQDPSPCVDILTAHEAFRIARDLHEKGNAVRVIENQYTFNDSEMVLELVEDEDEEGL